MSVIVWFNTFTVSENLNHPDESAAEGALTDEVAALPLETPVLIAPMVTPPMARRAMGEHVSKEMRKLALKYDVAKIGERNVGTGMNFYTLDREVEMGRAWADEVERQVRLVSDPVVNEYVNRLGQNLVRNSDAKEPFTIKVVISSEVNAYALPGGFLYVNTGVIMAADNEAQLAGVMAHEIAHVAARHTTHNLSRGNLISLCTLPTLFVMGPVGLALREATEIAMPMQTMKFSRDAEREADLLGMQYAYATGYDPAAIVAFFEKVEAQEKKKKGFLSRAFDTHPMTADRVKRAQEEMNTMLPPKDDYVVSTNEFDDVKARLTALMKHQAVEDASSARPRLRRSADSDDGQQGSKTDDRPTLRRNPGN